VVGAALTLLAAGCGDDELSGSTEAVPSTTSSPVSSATTSSSRSPATPSTTSSTNEAADPVADILAAAAAHWLSVGEHATFRTLHVVDRLGKASKFGTIEFGDNAPQMTDLQRRALKSALAPRMVMWTHDLESVAGTAMTIPRKQAVVMFAEPTIKGGRAEIVLNLWCGMMCGGGIGLVLERSSTDEWMVTDEFDGFVA
jgi:hypothetical protein